MLLPFLATLMLSIPSFSKDTCTSSNITRCYENYGTLIQTLTKRVHPTFAPRSGADVVEVWKLYGRKYVGGPIQITFKGQRADAVGVAICDSEKLKNPQVYTPEMICYYIDIYKNDGEWWAGTGGRKIGHY